MHRIQNHTTGAQQFRRFLLTGSENGVYHAGPLRLDPERTPALLAFVQSDGEAAVDALVGAANARSEAALYALAVAASPRFAAADTNARALAALPIVARKAQHMALFAGYVAKTRGWGRGLRSAVAAWYGAQPVASLASQILRRPASNLKMHRSLLRLSHPKASTLAQNALYQWISDGRLGHLATAEIRAAELRMVEGFERMRQASSAQDAAGIVEVFRLGPSQVPARWRSSPQVWEALFDHLQYRELLRYLPAMTSSGMLSRQSENAALAVARIADRKRIAAARTHPVELAAAMVRYRGAARIAAVESVFDALDEALQISAACQSAMGLAKDPDQQDGRVVVAVDGTASMQGAAVCGMPGMSASLAAASLAMGIAKAGGSTQRRTGPLVTVVPFHREVGDPIEIDSRTRIAGVLNQIRATPSRSDPGAVMECATRKRQRVNTFVIVTDRTADAAGLIASLRRYRETMGIEARLALFQLASRSVAGWEAEAGTVAFAGLDPQAPVALHGFLAEGETER